MAARARRGRRPVGARPAGHRRRRRLLSGSPLPQHPGRARVTVRPRRGEDLPALLVLLQRLHETVGYPVRRAAVSAQWLASEHELGGWTALDGDRPVGHVALHPQEEWASVLGRDGLAVVSRLCADGTVPGTGGALLDRAVAEAGERGLEPVLQVDPDSPARGWYLRRGWREAAVVRQQWGHRTVDAVVMEQVGLTGSTQG